MSDGLLDGVDRVQAVPGAQSEVIVKAAYRMARLFVRLFGPYLRTMVLSEMVLQAGVEEAAARCRQEFPGMKPTLSKLILMTGVPFKRVKEILSQPKRLGDQHICTEAAVLAQWQKDPALRDDESGELIDLPVFGYSGSFQGLVARLGGRGVSVQTVLDRLVDAGNVVIVNKHFVRLINPVWRFIKDNEDEFLDCGVRALDCLGNSIYHNLVHRHEPDKKYAERRVYSLRIADVEAGQRRINALLLKQKEEMLALLNALESDNGDESTVLIGVGYYYWTHHDMENHRGNEQSILTV